MPRPLFVAGVTALCALTLTTAAQAAAQAPLAQPTLNPHTNEVAFVSGGDIWVGPAGGGVAHLLVSHEANESRPLYAPDGTKLAFESDRAGSDDLYVLDLASGGLTRITWSDAGEILDAWSPDGQWLYFTTGEQDIGGMVDVYRVAVTGGEPVPVAADRYQPEYQAGPSPDGRRVAVAAIGRMGVSQWWRNGSSHIDEAEIWLVTPGMGGAAPSYRRLTAPGAKHLWPMWTADGVVYMSDRSGTENLWLHPLQGDARQLTRFTDGRLLWPTLASDGRTVVFERDFGIWSMTLPDGTARRLDFTLRGAAQAAGVEHERMTSGFSGLALSPDGKKVAFTVRGDVFAADADDGGKAERVTRTTEPEGEIAWAPDSRRIAYTSRRSGEPKVFLYDFGDRSERQLTTGAAPDATPVWSPDGTQVAFVRDTRQLIVVNVENGRERVLAEAQLWRDPFTPTRGLEWSPDGDWLAFFATDSRLFTNVHVVPADGSAPERPISRLANAFASTLSWAPDGKSIYFDTQHRTQTGNVARVDLVPRTPVFEERGFRELFEEPPARQGSSSSSSSSSLQPELRRVLEGSRAQAGVGGTNTTTTTTTIQAADTVDVTIDFDGIFSRLDLLPLGVDPGSMAISPDGKTLVVTASAEGQQNLYSFNLDPLAEGPVVAKQLTSTPGFKSTPQFTPDGKQVYFTSNGRIQRLDVGGNGGPRAVSVTAELDVDFDAEKVAVFNEGWTYLRDNFFDADMNGADWPAVHDRFAPVVAQAKTRQELERLMNLMVGELNASHLGHGEPSDGPDAETGRLGVEWDAGALADGRFVIGHIVPQGPAHVAGLQAGERVTAVNGQATQGQNLDRLLANTVGDLVELTVADARGRNERTVEVKPIGTFGQIGLMYRDWVESRRAYVDSVSNGRLGYVHMPDMGWGSLQRLFVDLDAANMEKDGVVVDVRANRGGFVNAYALDVFSRKGYITMEVRGYPTAPARSILGQRALERPVALVIDRNTLSDGEDFTEGWKTMGLGPVVGEATGGWIIYTWGLRLVDGSSFRMPRSKIRGAAGDVMEMNPRTPTVEVPSVLGESYRGVDTQLDAAVRALLGRIGG